MAQFDGYKLPAGKWIVDVQSDVLHVAETTMAIPLISIGNTAAVPSRLTPLLRVRDQQMILATHLMSAIERRRLGSVQMNLAWEEYTIKAAIDMLFSGF